MSDSLHNGCRLVKWDMRDPRGVVQDLSSPVVGYESGKDYSRGTNFTCMATTGVQQIKPAKVMVKVQPMQAD